MSVHDSHIIVTDITVSFGAPISPATSSTPDTVGRQRWHRIERDLYLHSAEQSAWLYVATLKGEELTSDDLAVTQVSVGEQDSTYSRGVGWERRPAGIWIQRNVLFGTDAVDPRPHWALMRRPLELSMEPAPDNPHPAAPLRVRENGKFRIVQISDTHMATGVGVCKDAIDADGNFLPPSVADPQTVDFIGRVLDIERPDLVVAPLIARSIPFAAMFSNHNAESTYALSPRSSQMALLRSLPFSFCRDDGPHDVEGVGNYHLQIFSHTSKTPLITEVKDPDYEPISKSQIEWLKNTSQELGEEHRSNLGGNDSLSHISLAFMHIPFPEYADDSLNIIGGQRREPTEGPSFNSHLYDALVEEGVVAVGCGHDHVNDFCGLLPKRKNEESRQERDKSSQLGPWLCYGGGSGFGGYCSYGENRYHRRMRVWEFDTNTGSIVTWKRVGYASERSDHLVLVKSGDVVAPLKKGKLY
ncbi:Metallo-dependent phosphatase-like protein [Xylaria sp. FL1042]|nr:Metallo-dependent phosphatase-like protein [Xylaria sp. FL1042]